MPLTKCSWSKTNLKCMIIGLFYTTGLYLLLTVSSWHLWTDYWVLNTAQHGSRACQQDTAGTWGEDNMESANLNGCTTVPYMYIGNIHIKLSHFIGETFQHMHEPTCTQQERYCLSAPLQVPLLQQQTNKMIKQSCMRLYSPQSTHLHVLFW